MPYRENPWFTGRSDALELIHQKLVRNAPPNRTSSYIIYGLGGVGKTQVAIEYSYQHRNDFDIVYWLRADDYDTLLTSYSQLYNDALFQEFTGLKLGDEMNSENIAMRLRLWFETCKGIRWLLVIDNADNLGRAAGPTQLHTAQTPMIANLIPKGCGGCILITSRDKSSLGQLAHDGMELYSMEEAEAKDFLCECSKTTNESEDAVFLVRELGRLPLAIEQAGGFIRENGLTIAEYRQLYERNRSQVLQEGLSETHRAQYYHETVHTTWNISFEAVQQRDPLAGTILRIAAFLDGKRIQKDLFYGANVKVDGHEDALSELAVTKAFGTLMSYSLIQSVPGEQSVEMHLLVQTVIREDPRTEKVQCFMDSAELVRKRFPWGGDANNLKSCLMYFS